MRFLMISDLHIKETDKPEDLKWVASFCKYVKEQANVQPMIVFVLGDIINGGKKEAFDVADTVFSYIKDHTFPVDIQFIFLPGNHDYCKGDINPFADFCRKQQSSLSQYIDFSKRDTWNFEYDNINFILCDTMRGEDYHSPGQLDISSIQAAYSEGKENVLLMHHRLLFEDDQKHGGIVNQTEVVAALRSLQIRFIVQGHAHFTRSNTSLSGLYVFGLGSLAMEGDKQSWIDNESKQFIVLSTFDGQVEAVTNMLYRGGEKRFVGYQMYSPSSNDYSDGTGIPFINCAAVKDYIPRTVVLREKAEGYFARYFNSEYLTSLLDACKEHAHVLLIADAGYGKSVELSNLAYCLTSENGLARPVPLSLRDYSGNSLKEFINEIYPEYSTLNPNRLYLLLDGYDELSIETANAFRKELNKYIHSFPETHICITMRSNFYTHSAEAFADFSVYQLLEIEREHINDELRKNNIDIDRFRNECYHKNLMQLLGSPFYLRELCQIYNANKALPPSSQLMETIIQKHIDEDSTKFEYAVNVEESKLELETALTRLAFGMQLLETSLINDRQYQQLLVPSDRKLLKYSSLTISKSDSREFLHNIFKEYLVAKYLSAQTLSTIRSYVYIEQTGKLNSSWFNVLGFLMQIKYDDELIQWLFQIDPTAITRFEKDRVNEEMRYAVLKIAIHKVETDNIWLSHLTNDPNHIARFSQSEKAVDMLLAGIEKPVHFRALSACISVIAEFDTLYGKDDAVRAALLKCVRNEYIRKYEKKEAIEAIASLKLQTVEITNELEHLFYSGTSSEVRRGIYNYITNTHQTDKKINIFLDGMALLKQNKDQAVDLSSEIITISHCIEDINSPDSIYKLLKWFASDVNLTDLFCDEAVHIIEKATRLYQSYPAEMFDAVFLFFEDPVLFNLRSYKDSIMEFFKKTDTIPLLLQKLSETDVERRSWVIMVLVYKDPGIKDILLMMYQQKKISDEFYREFVTGLHECDGFIKYAAAYQANTGEVLTPRPMPVDYMERERLDRQMYLNALFDKSVMDDLLNKTLVVFGNDTAISEITIDYRNRLNYPVGVEKLVHAMKRYADSTVKASDFFKTIDHDLFFKHEICSFLSADGKSPVRFSDDQIEYLKDLFHHIESHIDIAMQYRKDGNRTTCGLDIYLYLLLKRSFSWPSPENIVLDMVELPAVMVVGKDGFEPELKYKALEKRGG